MTTTRTRTETVSIAAHDVRKVWRLIENEISHICCQVAQVTPDFDRDRAAQDLALLGLHEIIVAARLQFYLGDELVDEYVYEVLPEPEDAWGPEPDQVDAGSMSAGTRLRLVADENPEVPGEERGRWFQRLGWDYVDDLREPAGTVDRAYGAYSSSGYSVRRRLRSNPRFDNMSVSAEKSPERNW